MRAHLATALLTLAVLFCTTGARAEGNGDPMPGRCVDRPMVVESTSTVSRLLVETGKTAAKPGDVIVSTILPGAGTSASEVQVPRQSRAPVMCSDPSQPGCHVDVPDAPAHQGWGVTLADGGDLPLGAGVIPPPGSIAFQWAPHADCGVLSAHARLPWRPPVA